MAYVTPTIPAVGDQITAAQGAVIAGDLAAGPNMGTPTTQASGLTGTVTSGATETRDAVLGNYTFTAVAGRRYVACINGLLNNGSVAADVFMVNIRNGGGSTPTAASTLVASSQAYILAVGAAGRSSCPVSGSFAPGAGTVTLGLFVVRVSGTGTYTPVTNTVGIRELYAVDIGPA